VFTGLIETCVPVRAVESVGSGMRLTLASPGPDWGGARGDSVAVSGVCLTDVGRAVPGADLVFDLSAETVERTWFGDLEPGRVVNLERSLRLGDRLGGHMVSGHVDGVGTIEAIEDSGDGGKLFRFAVGPGLDRYLIEKGSVALDGISLTVVEPEGPRFAVAIIPETLDVTSLGSAEVGQRVNVESDLVGKWIEKLLPPR
jgi:riboflavin synthase